MNPANENTIRRQKRNATLDEVLIEFDEPYLITLRSGKSRIIATAIPSDDPDAYMFLGTSVSERDWDAYLNESVDLLYIFTETKSNVYYEFDLATMKENKITMLQREEAIPEELLPGPHSFARLHTKPADKKDTSNSEQTLIVDGEWELTEFGSFQKRYSDIYSLMYSLKKIAAGHDDYLAHVRAAVTGQIFDGIVSRPYQGGFSYVHMFRETSEKIPANDRLALKRISYASPGKVVVAGDMETFESVSRVIRTFMHARKSSAREATELREFLKKYKYISMRPEEYAKAPSNQEYLVKQATVIMNNLSMNYIDEFQKICGENALLFAKLSLSLYRRVQDATSYFIQGRAQYVGEDDRIRSINVAKE
ncbi:MAG: hypothetical protein O9342_00245 [Beijerinckiaceae bacterium]|nr:hypothetical protein [Beijerinckiaceae bacterium]